MPTALGRELLQEAETDPNGLGFLDIERMLDEWGITEVLQEVEIPGYRTRHTPGSSAFFMTYPLALELHPNAVRAICARLREFERRNG